VIDTTWFPPARVVEVGGHPVRVRDSGGDDGRAAVVLLHGLGLTSDSCWFGTYARLARTHRVVAFDLRGHGSGLPVHDHFSIEVCADDAVAVADALGIARFTAVGYSIGGLVAQEIWHRSPLSLRGLVLCSTAHYPLTPVEWALAAAPVMGTRWRRGFASHPIGPPLAAVEYLLRGIEDEQVRAAVAQAAVAVEPWVFASALQAAAKFDARAWIELVDVPTAVIVTTRDAVIIPWRQRSLAKAIPNSSTYEVHAGHTAPMRHPHRWTQAIVAACNVLAAEPIQV